MKPKSGIETMPALPLEHIGEYDAAALYFATHGRLPRNMGSPGAVDWINADPEAFQERVRQCAYGQAMKPDSKPAPCQTPWSVFAGTSIKDAQNRNPEAMGKLFAAAPDLLAACEALERELSHWHGWQLQQSETYPASDGARITFGALAKAREAIAKAKSV